MQKVEELSNQQVKIAAGTLYGAIENLLKQKLIQSVKSEDKRRKVYVITEKGKEVLLLDLGENAANDQNNRKTIKFIILGGYYEKI